MMPCRPRSGQGENNMRLLVSSCARLFKTEDGKIYTPAVYGYEFYQRYLQVFDEVTVVGFCDTVSQEQTQGMLLVSGDRLRVFEVPYPHGEWDYIRKRGKIVRSLKHALDDCDAALLRVPETLCFLLMEKLVRQNKIPWAVEVIADPLNLYSKVSCPSKYRLVYKFWYHLQMRRACHYAHGTSYVTKFGLQEHYPPNLKPADHFTAHYTDTDIHMDEEIPAREFPEGRPIRMVHVAVSVGGFAKGHKETLESFSQMVKSGMDVELTLVGGGELAESNQRILDDPDVAQRIRFTGKLTPGQVFEELDRADVFFFPSYNEGLPRVVIEAMSRGLPVIATDIPGHRELLQPEYLVPVRNSAALVTAMEKLLQKPAYETASRRSLEKAKEYDFAVIREKRNGFYSQLRKMQKKGSNI